MYTTWWWRVGCQNEWTPDSVTKLKCDVKIISIYEEELSRIYFGSFIMSCSPSCAVIFSNTLPWEEV